MKIKYFIMKWAMSGSLFLSKAASFRGKLADKDNLSKNASRPNKKSSLNFNS